MEKAKELFAMAEARGEANIKAREDLNKKAIAIAYREQVVAEREQELQEKDEEVTNMLERRHNELSSHETDLDTHETTLEVDRRSLGDLRAEVLARKLTADLKANHLAFREKELADRDKQLAMTQPQELVSARKRVEELQAARANKAQKVWDFLGQTEIALVPLGFSPLYSWESVQEVSTTLPLLDSAGAKMLKLEEVICDQLEAEGRVPAEKVPEHMLTCFRSRDPAISLDPMMLRSIARTKEAANSDILEAAKAVAARF
jgi:hypothetical protein